MRGPSLAFVVLALAGPLAPGAARGAEIVQFQDGRVLEVERVEPRGEMLELSLEGGGAIAVPAWRVSSRRELERPVPEAPRPVGPAEAWRQHAGDYADLIDRAARTHRLDPVLLTAVARTESSLDPRAVSRKGASGLMQLMPQTATRFGVTNVFDVAQNVDGGARYLSWLLERFAGRTDLALAGYNAGEAAVDRYDGIPPYPETQHYVRKVLGEAQRLGGPGSLTE